MRITCPNCDAHYEVPENVIPDNGRDVQCSNCGSTWFQAKPEPVVVAPAPDDTPAAEDPAPKAESEDLQDKADEPQAESPTPEAAEEPEDAPAVPEPPAPDASRPPRSIDPAVAGILREEAEFEARARASEAPAALESQTEMPLDQMPENAAQARSAAARARIARLKGEGTEAPTSDVGSRRDLLPDIDEINSTLRAGEASAVIVAGAEATERKGGGFVRGFTLVVIVAVVFLLAYMNAESLADALPAMRPTLESYVQTVDQARVWLSNTVNGFAPQ